MLMFRLYPGQDVPIATVVDRTRRAYGLTAKPCDADQRHVSLLSIGSDEGVTRQLIEDAAAAAAQVRSPAFDLAFDRIVSFRNGRPKPLVLLCGEGANRVVELVSGIAEALNGFGFGIHLRAGFVPHCTVLRDDRLVPEVSLNRPILSRMREFHLEHSTNGGRLRLRIGRWPLLA